MIDIFLNDAAVLRQATKPVMWMPHVTLEAIELVLSHNAIMNC